MPRPSVFISAATSDYKDLRHHLADELRSAGFDVPNQESLSEVGCPTLTKIDKNLSDCLAVVHIVGPSFGGIADAKVVNDLLERLKENKFLARNSLQSLRSAILKPERKYEHSYTQWEAFLAKHHDVPLLVYQPKGGEFDVRQKSHLEALEAVSTYAKSFADKEDLLKLILKDLAGVQSSNQSNPSKRWQYMIWRVSLILLSLLMSAFIAVAVFQHRSGIEHSTTNYRIDKYNGELKLKSKIKSQYWYFPDEDVRSEHSWKSLDCRIWDPILKDPNPNKKDLGFVSEKKASVSKYAIVEHSDDRPAPLEIVLLDKEGNLYHSMVYTDESYAQSLTDKGLGITLHGQTPFNPFENFGISGPEKVVDILEYKILDDGSTRLMVLDEKGERWSRTRDEYRGHTDWSPH